MLEDRLVPGAVRQSVIEILKQPFAGELRTHKALLELSSVDGGFRLVTTNFDRRFLEAGSIADGQVWRAPALAPPKDYSWRSLVHLHGLIADDDLNGSNLVLTAADFGRAYLTEGWAARFVVELFRQFTVVFVGYGVNDPVLSYLVDALAAERSRGQLFDRAFAFAPHKRSAKWQTEAMEAWRAKGVVPIPYWHGFRHRTPHQTLVQWAALKRGGLTSRKQVALQEARYKTPSSPGSPSARRLVWALAEESGTVASAFADADPTPPFDWLDTLEKTTFTDQLSGVEGCSLLSLPSSVPVGGRVGAAASAVPLVGSASTCGQDLRRPTRAVADWLARHCADRRLLRWVLERGAAIHPDFAGLLASFLDKHAGTVPTAMKRVWEVLLGQRFREYTLHPSSWFEMVQIPGSDDILDPLVKQRVLQALRLVPVLRPAARFPDEPATTDEASLRPRDLARLDLRFSEEYAGSIALGGLRKHPQYTAFLAASCDDLTSLLKEGMEWFEVLGEADSTHDPSFVDHPSIAAHEQDRHPHEWTYLIDVLAEAIEAVATTDPSLAQMIVQRWASIRFPVFGRLVIHAGTEAEPLAPAAVSVLLRDRDQALWSPFWQREALRFLRLGAAKLTPELRGELERRILAGPPRSWYREDLSSEELARAVGRPLWLRLAKLDQGGGLALSEARKRLTSLAARYGWALDSEERDEFPIWIGPAKWVGEDANWLRRIVGSSREEMLRAVLEAARAGRLEGDHLRLLAQRKPSLGLSCMRALRREGLLSDEMAAALFRGLREVASPRSLRRNIRVATPLILELAQIGSPETTRAVAAFLEHAGKVLGLDERAGCDIPLLWRQTWSAAERAPRGQYDDALPAAINHPAGSLTLMLLRDILRAVEPGDSTVRRASQELLGLILDGDTGAHRLARVVLTSQLLFAFSVAREAIGAHLVGRFDWARSAEAHDLWEGFLHAPRVSADLFGLLHRSFLETFDHLESIAEEPQRVLGDLLGGLAVHLPSSLSNDDARAALRKSTEAVMLGVLGAFILILKADQDRAPDVWKNLAEWFQKCWPRDKSKRSPYVSFYMAELALAGGKAFPAIVSAVHPFLVPGAQGRALHDIGQRQNEVAGRFPEPTLALLAALISPDPAPHSVTGLSALLECIRTAWRAAVEDRRFKRLADLAERLGNP